MQHPVLTETEFQEWLLHPATQSLRLVLTGWVAEAKESWASGTFTDMSQFGTAILNAKAIGGVELCTRVLGLDFEQLQAELENASQ